jgi:phosphoenolpyruvate carboxykinase (GTP)
MPAPQFPKPGIQKMTTNLPALEEWVNQVAQLTQPESIHWCSGDAAEYHHLIGEMIEDGTLSALNDDGYPNCYLHLSDPNDVARVNTSPSSAHRSRKTPAPITTG